MINLFGGPCSGKSGTAAHLFAHLKSHHVNAGLISEVAQELIYAGNEVQLVNQAFIMGSQYKKQKDLERSGVEVAITDGPLLLQLVYCQNKDYFNEIAPLIIKLNSEFDNTNIFLERQGPFQTYGRVHTEAQSKVIDKLIWDSMDGHFHYVVPCNSEGIQLLCTGVLGLFDQELLAKF